MKIFIAGCGRSGTTLTRDLMRCFEGVYAHKREAPISLFDRLDDVKQPNLIVKRTSACYKSLHKLPPTSSSSTASATPSTRSPAAIA